MRDLTKLACCGAALALALVMTAGVEAGKPSGGPKPVTQACELSGDATGGGNVGITASSRGPRLGRAWIVIDGGPRGVGRRAPGGRRVPCECACAWRDDPADFVEGRVDLDLPWLARCRLGGLAAGLAALSRRGVPLSP